MNKIKILSPAEAQKIAAGECIERPSNIVKEVIENSIDAGAKNITLYIEQAGKKLIRIVDDGCGLNPQDALTCFLPHATSKITAVEDLENINSFGFRGEALASISAVSKVQLTTLARDSENKVGTFIEYTQSTLVEQKPASCPIGTDIQIHDLFYNIPARKKFLKQDETEWNQILTIFQAFCLSNLNISFKLFHDNRMIINAPAVENVKTRVGQIWDHDIASNLVPLKTSNTPEWLKLEGIISQPNFWRYNRNFIFLFVNGRWIKNQELTKAIIKGYLNVLPQARFPAAMLFIECQPSLVDVNVHPKKEEVRFTKPGTVETTIFNSIKQTLEGFVNEKILWQPKPPSTENISNEANVFFSKPFQDLSFDTNFGSNFKEHLPTKESYYKNLETPQHKINNEPHFVQATNVENITPVVQKTITIETINNHKIIGQLFNTYILIENENEFVIIDQHAAHERVLYEKYLKNFKQKDGIKLLFPEIVELSQSSLQLISKHLDFFINQGIELEPVGPTTIAIRSTPIKLHAESLREIILLAAEFIKENDKLDEEEFRKLLNEHVHSHMACKAAIKAGNKLSHEQMEKLINDLSLTDKRYICIHGRPTIWTMSKDSMEKQFQRKL